MRKPRAAAAAALVCIATTVAGCGSGKSPTASDPDSPYPDYTATFLQGPPNQEYMEAKPLAEDGHRFWMLPATPQSTQWGVYDNSTPPVLRIDSGDTVAIQTVPAGGGQVAPGINEGQIEKINTAVPNRGPHTVTGPIYVNDAEPGDVLAVHINRIQLPMYATNNTAKGKGLFPDEFPEQVTSYYLDTEKMQMRFSPNVLVPLEPFPGILAVGRSDTTSSWCTDGKCSTEQPGKWGGNMDLPEMQIGSTTYLPVQVAGGLIWTGDSHAKQGNGEIDLDALETWFPELNITVDLIKNQPQEWPTVETGKFWVAVGYDEDLDKALDINIAEALKLIMAKQQVSETEAKAVLDRTWDCRISEVVDEVLGTYCVVPKDTGAARAAALPTADTADAWVSTGKAAKALDAMKIAASAALDSMARNLSITRNDAYHLATMVLDCRIERWTAGDKTVACLVPRSIKVPQ
ncbi:MAG: acetamidase/formamidase family protein [Mycobacterium sp.]|nr:acetamidase/formamidase family protein [Mycobacterium sp.]